MSLPETDSRSCSVIFGDQSFFRSPSSPQHDSTWLPTSKLCPKNSLTETATWNHIRVEVEISKKTRQTCPPPYDPYEHNGDLTAVAHHAAQQICSAFFSTQVGVGENKVWKIWAGKVHWLHVSKCSDVLMASWPSRSSDASPGSCEPR